MMSRSTAGTRVDRHPGTVEAALLAWADAAASHPGHSVAELPLHLRERAQRAGLLGAEGYLTLEGRLLIARSRWHSAG